MKKFFALLSIAFAAVTLSAADYTFPGWKCTDKAKITAAIAAAPDDGIKLRDSILLQLAETPPNTYAELCAIVDKTIDAIRCQGKRLPQNRV